MSPDEMTRKQLQEVMKDSAFFHRILKIKQALEFEHDILCAIINKMSRDERSEQNTEGTFPYTIRTNHEAIETILDTIDQEIPDVMFMQADDLLGQTEQTENASDQ